jgi:hypothetical protein
MKTQNAIHECAWLKFIKSGKTPIKSKEPDILSLVWKERGRSLHLTLTFCPFCGRQLKSEIQDRMRQELERIKARLGPVRTLDGVTRKFGAPTYLRNIDPRVLRKEGVSKSALFRRQLEYRDLSRRAIVYIMERLDGTINVALAPKIHKRRG